MKNINGFTIVKITEILGQFIIDLYSFLNIDANQFFQHLAFL